ncbi:hypothetical protein MRX96_011837 [Rhipicephalus microplus]
MPCHVSRLPDGAPSDGCLIIVVARPFSACGGGCDAPVTVTTIRPHGLPHRISFLFFCDVRFDGDVEGLAELFPRDSRIARDARDG